MIGRKQLITEFVKRNYSLCKAAFDQGLAMYSHNTKESIALVNKARQELSYSTKTYAGDIHYVLLNEYKRQFVNG